MKDTDYLIDALIKKGYSFNIYFIQTNINLDILLKDTVMGSSIAPSIEEAIVNIMDEALRRSNIKIDILNDKLTLL